MIQPRQQSRSTLRCQTTFPEINVSSTQSFQLPLSWWWVEHLEMMFHTISLRNHNQHLKKAGQLYMTDQRSMTHNRPVNTGGWNTTLEVNSMSGNILRRWCRRISRDRWKRPKGNTHHGEGYQKGYQKGYRQPKQTQWRTGKNGEWEWMRDWMDIRLRWSVDCKSFKSLFFHQFHSLVPRDESHGPRWLSWSCNHVYIS